MEKYEKKWEGANSTVMTVPLALSMKTSSPLRFQFATSDFHSVFVSRNIKSFGKRDSFIYRKILIFCFHIIKCSKNEIEHN